MAWNPSKEVSAARDIGERFNKDQVIILMVDQKKRTLEYASWGKTKVLCDDTKSIADIAYSAIRPFC